MVTHKRRNLAAAIGLRNEHEEDVTIVLEPAVSGTGTVTDSDGNALKGAEIEILIARGKNEKITFRGMMGAISTDSEGRYRTPGFPPLPEGFDYYLRFGKGWYYPKTVKLDVTDLIPGEVIGIDMSLTSGKRLLKKQE